MSKTSRRRLAAQRLAKRVARAEAVPVAAATDQYLPTAAEHAAWLERDPARFLHSSFTSEAVAEGVRMVSGELKDDEAHTRTPLAYHFDQTKFSATEARAWCDKKQIAVANFVPSKESMYQQVTAGGGTEPDLARWFAPNSNIAQAAGRLPRLTINPLYSGGALNLDGFAYPVVFDVAGIEIDGPTSVLYAHDDAEPIGQGTAAKAGGTVSLDGEITGTSDRAKQVIADAKNGYQWRASIGLEKIGPSQFIGPGETLRANGQLFTGPLTYWPRSRLKEASVLGNGADHTARVSIAAHAKKPSSNLFFRRSPVMDEQFIQWVKTEYDLDAKALTDAQKTKMQAAYKRQQDLDATLDDQAKTAAERQAALTEKRIAEAAEISYARITKAGECYDKLCRTWALQDAEHVKIRAKGAELRQQAIADKWTPDKIALEFLQLGYPSVGSPTSGASPQFDAAVMEAAFAKCSGAMTDLEKKYDSKVLEQADRREFKRLTLKGLLVHCARARGWQGSWIQNDDDIAEVLDCAFRRSPNYANAASGSTIQITGILSNLMNKFLYQAFWGVESVWRDVAYVRSVQDFKPHPAFRIFGNLTFDRLGPNGELKHGTIGETAYINQIDTRGKFLVTTRQNIIDDDMGALSFIPMAMGRGAAISLNNIFWGMVLTRTDYNSKNLFYTATQLAAGTDPCGGVNKDGKGQRINVNAFSGAGSSLTGTTPISALTQARQAFRQQVGPDGNPLGYSPLYMLVPPALESAANTIYTSSELRQIVAALGSTSVKEVDQYGTNNIFKGQFKPVVSAYIGATNAPPGSTGSDTAWYLVGNPSDIQVWELAFLDGNQAPTVQSSEANYDTLGIAHRGYHDFGAAGLEGRGAVYNAGT